MSIQENLKQGSNELKNASINQDHAWLDAEILLAHTLKKERSWIISHQTDQLTSTTEKRYKQLIARRKKHEPLPYLIGHTEFNGSTFLVNKHTLIPRPESEMFIEILQSIHPDTKTIIIDIGTGSGALAISLKKALPKSHVIAEDISRGALTLAKKNARLHNVNVDFIQGSLWSKKLQTMIKKQNPHHLIIVANLPYLPNSDKKTLSPSVTRFEPHSALFAGKTGNELIIQLLKQIKRWKKQQPETKMDILLEFDPPQAHTLEQTASSLFTKTLTNIHQDLCERPRILHIQLAR